MNYKITKRKGHDLELYQQRSLFNGTHEIGWILKAQRHLPIVYIYAKKHTLDKRALQITIEKFWPNSEGEFFLVTEHISNEILVPEDMEKGEGKT